MKIFNKEEKRKSIQGFGRDFSQKCLENMFFSDY